VKPQQAAMLAEIIGSHDSEVKKNLFKVMHIIDIYFVYKVTVS